MNLNVFDKNIRLLHNARHIVSDVICIPQVRNLEDELVRATDIDNVLELLSSLSMKEYKRDLAQIRRDRLALKLKQHHFQIDQLWSMNPSGQYQRIENGSDKIKQ